ncbi:glycerol kinase GlpK [Pseudopedobacter beijingensis]|uniref:Glycerol kinase n=1 Tax=Pseudopedobacter beijingensis TaxID=1207056 RepID=A0ABW4IAZ8_9SPHI
MSKYVLSLDQGTSSSRAIIFDDKGQQIAVAQKEFRQIYPQSGWVEHDAQEIWETQYAMAVEAINKSKVSFSAIKAIGITNQRETTLVWDKATGEPIYHAIVWQDRRTAGFCEELVEKGKKDFINQKTGLLIDAYFSATKLKWILDNVEGARKRAENGELLFGTMDTWLIWKLTKGDVHVTDVTNASRTMLYNINHLDWDTELLDLFEIPRQVLPQVKSSSEVYGYTAEGVFEQSLPIAGIAGDQQAALFGQLCTQSGMVKNTYGTGCFMLMNVGEKPVLSSNKLLTTIAWQINGKVNYALEGSVFMAGAIVQWLRDGLQIIKSSSEVEELASTSEDNGGVYVVPAFTGLGAPYWNAKAKGTIFGLSRGSESAHIARAALESIAYQVMDVLNAMEADSGIKISELRVDGGAVVNNLLMQFQADVLGAVVVRPQISETTAVGVAYLAGLAVGVWEDVDEIQQQWVIDKKFTSQHSEVVNENINQWKRAVKAVTYWTEI